MELISQSLKIGFDLPPLYMYMRQLRQPESSQYHFCTRQPAILLLGKASYDMSHYFSKVLVVGSRIIFVVGDTLTKVYARGYIEKQLLRGGQANFSYNNCRDCRGRSVHSDTTRHVFRM